MAIKTLVERYTEHREELTETSREKLVVSSRITLSANTKLTKLAESFRIKRSALAAELLEAAIDEAWIASSNKRSLKRGKS
jgi:hypothetical protein